MSSLFDQLSTNAVRMVLNSWDCVSAHVVDDIVGVVAVNSIDQGYVDEVIAKCLPVVIDLKDRVRTTTNEVLESKIFLTPMYMFVKN